MARKWKILIGVVVAVMVVGCVGLPIAGGMLFGSRIRQQGWGPGMMPGWKSGEAHRELEVELIDDDGDGVPDRGVIELPTEMSFGPGHFVDGRFGPGGFNRFGSGRGMGLGGRAFGPFLFVRGLVRLAILAGVIALGVVFYRKWRKAHPVTPPAAE